MLEVTTICVQTGLNPARHILEGFCQYVRCHCMNSFGDVCFQGVYGSWFVFIKQNKPRTEQTLSEMTDQQSGASGRKQAG
jgi:hypothetical protein